MGSGSNLWINPTFKIANLEVHWYAICILVGVIIAVIMGVKEGKRLGISSDYVYTGVIITVPIALIGTRLWYVLFNLDQGWTFQKILGIDGSGLAGLAIQGGLIAALITVYIYCRIKKISLYKILDIVAPGFLIGQICGRWGNFCNHELYGPIIENPASIKWFPWLAENMYINGAYRHPTFLYESLLNLVGFIIILVARRKFKKLLSGDLIGFYLVWYGIVRIITETLRSQSGAEEVLMVGGIHVSILVSILFIIAGLAFLIIKRFVGPKDNYLDILKEVENNKFDTILFDLDGTILNSKQLIFSSFVHTFEIHRPDYQLTDEELESFFGPTLQQSFSRYSNDQNEIDEMIKTYREYNVSHHDEMVEPISGAKALIKTLHNKGYKVGVVSSKKTDLVMHGLEVIGVFNYMDIIIGCDEVKNHKPAPDGILLAIKELDSKNALYVGDTINDIKAGKAANIKTCGCLYVSDPDKIIDEKPDYVIKRLEDILKICVE